MANATLRHTLSLVENAELLHCQIENGVLQRYEGAAACVVIPEMVREIGAGAFAGNVDLKSVVLPEGLLFISESAFHGCSSLESVTLPGSVINVKRKAFCGCTSLKELKLEDGSVSIFLEDSAFRLCTSLETLETSRDVEYIGKSAFADCLSLRSVILRHRDMIFVSKDAFAHCPRLRRIDIGGDLGFTLPFLPPEEGVQKHHVKRVCLGEKTPLKRSVCCGKRLTLFTKRCPDCKLVHTHNNAI